LKGTRWLGSIPCWLVLLDLANTSAASHRIYFDIAVGPRALGRLVVRLDRSHGLERTVENVRRLCTAECAPIDPRLSYSGCAFEFSPSYVEGPQYKWAHVLKGRGRNAVGRADARLDERAGLAQCVHSCFGGQYYGMRVPSEADGPSTWLTVPVAGPGSGSSRIALVRVRDSPPQWRERLLLNSAVLGALDAESEPVLRQMARAAGPSIVEACGVLS
jgi:hypothetical protein